MLPTLGCTICLPTGLQPLLGTFKVNRLPRLFSKRLSLHLLAKFSPWTLFWLQYHHMIDACFPKLLGVEEWENPPHHQMQLPAIVKPPPRNSLFLWGSYHPFTSLSLSLHSLWTCPSFSFTEQFGTCFHPFSSHWRPVIILYKLNCHV